MKRKPRIALFGEGVIGGGILGQGVPVLRSLLERICVEFDVVLFSLIPVVVRDPPKGLTVHSFSTRKIPVKLKSVLLLLTFFREHLFNSFCLIFAVSAFPAGRFGVWLGMIFRKPVVVLLTTSESVALPEIGFGELLQPKLRKINRWVCEKADELVVLTEFQKQIAVRHLDLTRPIKVVPLMIDIEKFPYHEHKVDYPVRLLHVAYFHPVKDQLTLFRAFAILSKTIDCSLTVVGDGFQSAIVRQWLKELDISDKVHFAGTVLNNKLQPFFLEAHILLQSSRYETQGVAVLEAMASGVPVCGTSVGIVADLGNAYAAEASVGDAEMLAARALQLIKDPGTYLQMQKSARVYVETHSAEWSAKQYVGIFKNLMGKFD